MKKLLKMSEEEIDALDEDVFQEHLLELSEEDQLNLLEKFPELKELIEDPFASFKEGMSPEEAAEFDKLQKDDVSEEELDDMSEEELDALLEEEEENEELISDEELDEFIEDNFSEDELKEIDELIENQKNDNSKKISEEDFETGLSEEELKELDD
tara:strand:- start:1611 stop:2078 length:468 start_codon:yes stop_codon:yes gene_type:complete